jgi:C4-dicarboxylate transporter, DctM subunit
MTIAIVFAVLVALIVLGLPIAVAMGLTTIGAMLALGDTQLLVAVPQRMYSATTSFPLLAIPFFIFAGNLMNTGGMTDRIFRFARCCVGHIKGGLGHVNVVASMIFSGMTGAALADAMGVGVVTINAMEKGGYDRRFAAAISAASATIGPVIPPSIPMVIFGAITGTSVGRLFLGGVVPGLVMGLVLMATVYMIARRRGYPRERRATLREFWDGLVAGLLALAMPGIVIGGILSGAFTPTEASVIASLYALLLGLIVYREIGWKKLADVIWESVDQTIRVMFIIATAGVFGWYLVYLGAPDKIIHGLLAFSDDPWTVLTIVNLVLLVLGCFMEGTAIMLLTVPVLMPVIVKVGIDPVHFGVMMTLNLMIGMLTPPVGMVLYAISSVGNIPVWTLAKDLTPYIIALMVALALVAYIPSVVVWLPNLLMGGR